MQAAAASPGRISATGNSGFHSSDPYANTHQPAPFGFAASVAVSDSESCSSESARVGSTAAA